MKSTRNIFAHFIFELIFAGFLVIQAQANPVIPEQSSDTDLAAGSQLSIVGEPKNVQIIEGQNIELSCEAFGTPVPTIEWLHNGKVMKLENQSPQQRQNDENKNVQNEVKKFDDLLLSSPLMAERIQNLGIRTFQMSTTSSKIHIPCATKDAVGIYTCVTSNGKETVTANATVTITQKENSLIFGNKCPRKRADDNDGEAAQIYMWTDSRMERPGVTVQLMCRATGNPTPKIIWFEKIEQDGATASRLKPVKVNDPRYDVLPNGDLLVKQTPSDVPVSMFQCTAINKHGQDSVTSMLLEILDDTSEMENEIENQNHNQPTARNENENENEDRIYWGLPF